MLVAGWFSFDRLGATAGDLMARDVACEWLQLASRPYDVANAAPFEGGIDWRRVDPLTYTQVVFVCGPFWARRNVVRWLPRSVAGGITRLAPFLRRLGLLGFDRFAIELLIRRFSHARFLGLDLSMLGPPGSWHPFEPLLSRDGPQGARPDLALAGRASPVPVVGVVLVERPSGYDRPMPAAASEAVRGLAESRPMARVHIDTRLDVPNRAGLRTPAEIESLISRMDVVITTRLHGMVLAIKNDVPPLVIDPIGAGAKVRKQAETLGWPVVFTADALEPAALADAFDFCLSPEARARAADCRQRAVARIAEIREAFIEGLGSSPREQSSPAG